MLNIKRYPGNPVLSPDPDISWMRTTAMNPGVVFDGNLFRMLFTAGGDDGALHLGYAESADGYHFTVRTDRPFLSPSENFNDFDHGTVDDPRITFLEGKHYIVYAARSWNTNAYAAGKYRLGPEGERYPTWRCNFRRIGLAATSDWSTVERLGPLSSIHLSDANAVLFPEKIDGRYVYLHRPTPSIPWTLPMHYCPGAIWILFTDRIDHWASQRREMPWNMVDEVDIPDDVLLIRPEEPWEALKIGALGVPIPTEEGFWTFYHGVDRKGVYRLGVLLLDRDDPRRVLYRSRVPLMAPETAMETSGSYPGCIFPCSNVVVGDEVYLYYGAGDNYCCLATCRLSDLRKLYRNETSVSFARGVRREMQLFSAGTDAGCGVQRIKEQGR